MLKHSTLLLANLQNWGMTSNGKCLTARTSEFPRIGKECSLSDILEDNPDQKYFLSDKLVKTLLKKSGKNQSFQGMKPLSGGGCEQNTNSEILEDGEKRPIHKGEIEVPYVRNPYNGKQSETETGTLGTSCGTRTGKTAQLLHKDMRIRRLTPTECERLQGFPDGFTEGVSDTQRYKTLGNAVTVNVVYEVARRLTLNTTLQTTDTTGFVSVRNK